MLQNKIFAEKTRDCGKVSILCAALKSWWLERDLNPRPRDYDSLYTFKHYSRLGVFLFRNREKNTPPNPLRYLISKNFCGTVFGGAV